MTQDIKSQIEKEIEDILQEIMNNLEIDNVYVRICIRNGLIKAKLSGIKIGEQNSEIRIAELENE
jgi:hypothetical protein